MLRRALAISLFVAGMATLLALSATAQERRGRGGRSARDDDAPKTGDVAPPFKIQTLDRKHEVELGSFRGKRPVVLIFGSYT